jgi:hypothetical protein
LAVGHLQDLPRTGSDNGTAGTSEPLRTLESTPFRAEGTESGQNATANQTPGTVTLSTAEFQALRQPFLELIHRQRLISAGFGADTPTLSDLIESYVVVLLETHTLRKTCELLDVNRQTLRHWMLAWDGKEEGRRDFRLTRWKA